MKSRVAPALLLGSGFSQYIGASLAVGLFASAHAAAVGWARILVGATILLLWRHRMPRTALGTIDWRGLGQAALFGLTLGGMNLAFYVAIDHIAMGTAVALEYIGPVLLAAVTGRGWKVRTGIVLACFGVFLISWAGVDLSDPAVAVGVAFAFAAGALWALYMWLGRKVATGANALDSLAWAMVVAALVYAPLGAGHMGSILTDWTLIATMVAVGVLSSVLPYVIDQVVMHRVPAATFALLNSLLPATSLVVGVIMLGQVPNLAELGGLIAISTAVALATLPERRKSKIVKVSTVTSQSGAIAKPVNTSGESSDTTKEQTNADSYDKVVLGA